MQQRQLLQQNNSDAIIKQENDQSSAGSEQTFDGRCNDFFVLSDIGHIVHTILLDGIAKHHLGLEAYLLTDVQPREWHAYADLKLVVRGKFFDVMAFYEGLKSYSNIVCQRCEMTLIDNQMVRCSSVFSIYLPMR